MLKELYFNAEISYQICDEYNAEFLEPVGKYVLWKLKNNWDDYNELYHAAAFFEKTRKNKTIKIDTHLMYKDKTLSGVVFVLSGKLRDIEKRFLIKDEKKSLLAKYFHIVEKGRGYGQKWMKEIIYPYYKPMEYKSIYLSSSHPDSFQFYEKFGKIIGEYHTMSDNHLYERQGKFFLLDL